MQQPKTAAGRALLAIIRQLATDLHHAAPEGDRLDVDGTADIILAIEAEAWTAGMEDKNPLNRAEAAQPATPVGALDVERLARALVAYLILPEQPEWVAWEDLPDSSREAWRENARGVLAAYEVQP